MWLARLRSDVLCQAQFAQLSCLHADGREVDCGLDRAEEKARPEDVGEQALIRGLGTAFPCVRPGLSVVSKSGVDR